MVKGYTEGGTSRVRGTIDISIHPGDPSRFLIFFFFSYVSFFPDSHLSHGTGIGNIYMESSLRYLSKLGCRMKNQRLGLISSISQHGRI